jgi:Flp pilus assembly protein TadD
LEQAVSLLPHDAINRYNLGLSLVCAGDYERGEQEVRRAMELGPNNATMEALLNALVERKRSGN